MKKQNLIFSIVTSFCVMLSAMFIFTACGNKAPKCFYFTVDAFPVHVEEVFILSTTGGKGSDDKGDFLVEGDIAEVWFNIEEGYNLGTLKVLSNGEELTLSEAGEYSYKATFEPTEDFVISFTGAVAPKVAYLGLEVHSWNSNYHDRIMVEIDRYELFDFEEKEMTFSKFKNAVENKSFSLYKVDYDTPIAISVYTVGEYDFAISEQSCVQYSNTGIGYKEQVEKIVDEENKKYGYKHIIRFSENNTIKITDEVLTEYLVDFTCGEDKVSMNKELFALSVNGEECTSELEYGYIKGVIKFSDFSGSELPKLKIEFLKYNEENYKKFYNDLTFNFDGKECEKSTDGSYVEIELNRYYKYDFKTDCYIVTTNALELLKDMDKVVEKSLQIDEAIKFNGVKDGLQYDYTKVVAKNCLGRSSENKIYFFKNEFLTFKIYFYNEVSYNSVYFGNVVVKIGDNSNPDIKITKGLDAETNSYCITINVKASVETENIDFRTEQS